MILFEAFIQNGEHRSGPLFSTGDRLVAWDLAHVAERTLDLSGGAGRIVLQMVEGGRVLDDRPDWKHPDFRRPRCPTPLLATAEE